MALLRLCLAAVAFVRAVVFLTSCHLLRVLFVLIMPSSSETVLGAEEPQVSRTFYDFLASVDGTGRRGADFLLKAAGVFLNSGYEMELDLVGAGAGDIHQGCVLSLCLKVCHCAEPLCRQHCGASHSVFPCEGHRQGQCQLGRCFGGERGDCRTVPRKWRYDPLQLLR